jgi:NitT/TauT family transport system ATP-binding protein
MAAVIETKNLAVAFGEGNSREIIFQNVNISVEEGEFVTLVGVSGAGKSTMLRVISDLIPPADGSIQVNAAQVPDRRPISMVFQAANLMPWRTIAENIQLGLEGIDVSDEEKKNRTESTLSLVGLPEVADHRHAGRASAYLEGNQKVHPVRHPRYRGGGLPGRPGAFAGRQAG